MKKLLLRSFSFGVLLLFISCSTEPYTGEELTATNLQATSNQGCETGFAICEKNISTCFIEDGFNRWGWTIGPVSPGKHVFPIYTGAGQCDTSKGSFSAKVRLNYEDGVATVLFIANDGNAFEETHLYIGNDPYPMQVKGKKVTPTVAPGQYPYQHGNLDNATRDTYSVDGLSGDIYIIAHAVVCNNGPV